MISNNRQRWPITITYFFLSCIGFGIAKNKKARRWLNISLFTFLIWSMAAVYFITTNLFLYVKRGVVSEIIGASFGVITSGLTTFKLITFTAQRTSFERLLYVTNETLWIQWWTEYGKIILDKCHRQAKLYFLVFFVSGHVAGAGWIVESALLNMKSNSSDPTTRHIPAAPMLGVPVYESPNYEIFYAMNVFGLYIITILQRFEVLNTTKSEQSLPEPTDNDEKIYKLHYITTDFIFQEFKKCVKQHQFLISLVDDIENIYNIMNLGHVLLLSFIICVGVYPFIMPGASVVTSFKNVVFVTVCIIQLLVLMLSCHDIVIASSTLGTGIYLSKWYEKNNTKRGRALSNNYMFVMMRSKYPCYLTGGKFFLITSDTLKSILTTAFSYLTLLRQTMKE